MSVEGDAEGRTRPQRAFAVAMALPVATVAATAVARFVWPNTLGRFINFSVMFGAGLVGCLLGSWLIYRALRSGGAFWVLAVVLYDVAMPVALFGFAVLIEAAWGFS